MLAMIATGRSATRLDGSYNTNNDIVGVTSRRGLLVEGVDEAVLDWSNDRVSHSPHNEHRMNDASCSPQSQASHTETLQGNE